MSKRASTSGPKVTAFDWPTSSDPIPHGANVVIGFHGLMCFCHRHSHSDRNCEVGIHNNSPAHNLSIVVYRVAPTFDPPYDMNMGIDPQTTPPFAGPFGKGQTGSLKGNIVRFKVDDPSLSGVRYFQSGAGPRDHPHNFRHIIDLERDIYPGEQLPKKGDRMGPRVRINHGLFYTLCRTETQFEKVEVVSPPVNPPTPIGSLARMVGANIYLRRGGKVTLKMPAADDVVMREADGKFFVLVDNGCAGCQTNDFPLYYHTFDPPMGNPVIFDLQPVGPAPIPSPPPGSPCDLFLRQVDDILRKKNQLMSTDEAPCGAAGFGSSGTIS